MTPEAFRGLRVEREAEWRRLEHLVTICETKSPRALDDQDLMALPVLYRSALSSLSVARVTSQEGGGGRPPSSRSCSVPTACSRPCSSRRPSCWRSSS